mgnify:CR=1 FL=1
MLTLCGLAAASGAGAVLLVFGKPQAAPSLDGTSWNATQVGDLPVPEGVTVSLNFVEGQLTGKAACNSYFAGYTQQEDRLSIESAGVTEMYCVEEGVMELEQAFLNILPKVRSFQIQMGGLVLLDENGKLLEEPTRLIVRASSGGAPVAPAAPTPPCR